MATCVGQNNLKPIANFKTPEGRAEFRGSLEGRTARAVVSQTDRQTVMNVQSLEIDTGTTGNQRRNTTQSKCVDCAEVQTGQLEQGTDFLSTELKLNMAGTAAAAGILWLAIVSG